MFIFIAAYISRFFENSLKIDSDEAVQTAQDYSLLVVDPNPDSSDPDEWYKFFSRFGSVKYVTITIKNSKLKDMLKKKHSILKQLQKLLDIKENIFKKNYGGYSNSEFITESKQDTDDHVPTDKHYMFDIESPRTSMKRSKFHLQEVISKIKSYENVSNRYSDDKYSSDEERDNAGIEHSGDNNTSSSGENSKTLNQSPSILQFFEKSQAIRKLEDELHDINQKLSVAFRQDYEVNQVFVVFDYEEHQRLAIKELEVPDIETMNTSSAISKIIFRGSNILEVCEPPEPDNVLWTNTELSGGEKFLRKVFANALTIGIFVGCFYAVRHVQNKDSTVLLPVVIGAIDSVLPIIFYYITNQEGPTDEGKRQKSLQVKLFGIRLLLSSVFPYLNTPWNSFFDLNVIFQNFNVLIASCFTDPVMAFLGIPALVTRYIVGPLLFNNQEALNRYWAGAKWSIAEI